MCKNQPKKATGNIQPTACELPWLQQKGAWTALRSYAFCADVALPRLKPHIVRQPRRTAPCSFTNNRPLQIEQPNLSNCVNCSIYNCAGIVGSLFVSLLLGVIMSVIYLDCSWWTSVMIFFPDFLQASQAGWWLSVQKISAQEVLGLALPPWYPHLRYLQSPKLQRSLKRTSVLNEKWCAPEISGSKCEVASICVQTTNRLSQWA